jgi:hypothetical protein
MVELLDVSKIRFEEMESGFLRLVLADGTVHERVDCVPLFPLSDPDNYLSVIRAGEEKGEVGIIRSLDSLDPAQRSVVRRELSIKYFTPRILDIHSISGRGGTFRLQVVTDKGDRTLKLRNLKENLEIRENGLVLITDIDKCRYQIRDYRRLPPRARYELERRLI